METCNVYTLFYKFNTFWEGNLLARLFFPDEGIQCISEIQKILLSKQFHVTLRKRPLRNMIVIQIETSHYNSRWHAMVRAISSERHTKNTHPNKKMPCAPQLGLVIRAAKESIYFFLFAQHVNCRWKVTYSYFAPILIFCKRKTAYIFSVLCLCYA